MAGARALLKALSVVSSSSALRKWSAPSRPPVVCAPPFGCAPRSLLYFLLPSPSSRLLFLVSLGSLPCPPSSAVLGVSLACPVPAGRVWCAWPVQKGACTSLGISCRCSRAWIALTRRTHASWTCRTEAIVDVVFAGVSVWTSRAVPSVGYSPSSVFLSWLPLGRVALSERPRKFRIAICPIIHGTLRGCEEGV